MNDTFNDTLIVTNNNSVYEIFNLKSKRYPNNLLKLKKCSFDTIKGLSKNNIHNGNSTEEQLKKYLKKRVKDRKEQIIDLALCNNWKYFVTLTFDSKNIEYFPNGYSHDRAIELLRKWIDNQKHKNNNMRYILVSEFHKESGNLHFHGLFNNVSWTLKESVNPHNGKLITKNGCQIFNLCDYSLGFTTISEIKDSRKVSYYLSKYITKDLISLKNKKVFWHSRNLDKPTLNYSYIDSSLETYISNKDCLFYKNYIKENSNIEIAEVRC